MRSRSTVITGTVMTLAFGVLSPVPMNAAAAATGTAVTDAAGTSAAPLSRIHNRTNIAITARKDWTCSTGTTGSSSTGCVGGASRTVAAYDKTPLTEDWDVVQVDAGWCYKIKFVIPFKEWTLTFNQVGQGNRYVKVEDHADAYVTSQKAGSC
ncbi:hypothetical protein [Planomonospora venezuelensis]|uniref:Secreted protein n=1 Tax=Planomonospora venezuelensis TaxID=1999 RepID=A0A841D6B0_PLAVE|nr:hypothetical protein [Planomonospora venezuelensis]MBB5964007.1 hypothetical protein [Planomonospora venezuelensis]GIN05057.1 hypothetical protein Pve01_67150 [Planomonospora venezuelensis]